MNIIDSIQQEAHINQWPYPKTFEALKSAGVTSYTVILNDHYHALYTGSFGRFEHKELKDYKPLIASKQFSSDKVREAIINHAHGKTNYIEFLEDIAKAGVSHYHVNMDTREIRYFNPDETYFHQEVVP